MPDNILPIIVIFAALMIAAAWMIRNIKKDRVKKEIVQQQPCQLPFPQHMDRPGCPKPDHVSQEAMDAAVKKAYGEWLATFMLADFTPGRAFLRIGVEKRFMKYQVLATSVGQGYAMLISALFAGNDLNAQGRFDRLLTFCDAHPSAGHPHLMSWQVSPDMTVSKALASFSQGDMLIAYALLMADRQWGSKGDYNYHAIALKIVQALKAECIHPELFHILSSNEVKADDEARWMSTRSADVAPLFFTAFQHISYDDAWNTIGSKMLALLEGAESLPGAFIRVDRDADAEMDEVFDRESAPLLFHLALAALFAEDASAQNVLTRMAGTLKAANPDGRFVSAYSLEGTPQSKESDLSIQAGMAAAAMCMGDQPWLNLLWDQLCAAKVERNDPAGSTLRLMALILLSGNWWQA